MESLLKGRMSFVNEVFDAEGLHATMSLLQRVITVDLVQAQRASLFRRVSVAFCCSKLIHIRPYCRKTYGATNSLTLLKKPCIP